MSNNKPANHTLIQPDELEEMHAFAIENGLTPDTEADWCQYMDDLNDLAELVRDYANGLDSTEIVDDADEE